MDRRALDAVTKLVRKRRRTARKGPVWDGIHEATGLGRLVGREYHFSSGEVEQLRQVCEHETGIDPLLDDRHPGRIEQAGSTANEKLAKGSVFGRLLLFATCGSATVPTLSGAYSVPQGGVLAVQPDQVDRVCLQQNRVILVENGALLEAASRFRLPAAWRDAVLLYRGHGENGRAVQGLVESLDGTRLGLFFDFDLAGLDLMYRLGKGVPLVPADWSTFAVDAAWNQRAIHFQQRDTLGQRKEHLPPVLAPLVDHILAQRLAVMQETMIARGWSLMALEELGAYTTS